MSETVFSKGERATDFITRELIRRLAGFLAPHRRMVIIAALLIPLCIALELVLPVITRTAIDRFLVPYHLHLQTEKLDPSLQEAFQKAVKKEQTPGESSSRFISEQDWRRLNPPLIAKIRSAGAVEDVRYYATVETERNQLLVDRYPDLFRGSGSNILIAENKLQQLAPEELKLLRRTDAYGLIVMAVLFSTLAVLLQAVSYLQTMYLEQAGQLMMKDVRSTLFHHILTRSQFFFDDNPVGKLVTRLNNDVQSMAELFRHMVAGLFKELFLFIGITVVMFTFNVRLASVCMLVVPPMAILAWIFARISKRIFHQLKASTGRVNMGLQETIAGMDTVRLLGAQNLVLQKLTETNHGYFTAGMAQTKMFAVFTPLMEFLGSLAIALIIWYGGGNVLQDRLSLGTLVAFLTYIQMLLVPIRGLSEKYNQLQGALASTERIFILLDDNRTLPTTRTNNVDFPQGDAEIVFDRVDFGYQSERMILHQFHLVIPKGETVTLVGPSGGGKTTLVNLLLRLYDPLQGEIRLGTVPLKNIPVDDLVRRIALVSQETILLADDIEANILLGRRGIAPSMLELAVQISGVNTWLDTLPQGIHTRIGEGGRQLSHGQCRMLALARALAGDPRILILDEAYSRIDPKSEQLIQSRLPSIMAGRTCITVAHRLSTARHSNRILVIRDGQIIEDGDHQALMDIQGVYADMVALERCRA